MFDVIPCLIVVRVYGFYWNVTVLLYGHEGIDVISYLYSVHIHTLMIKC